MGHSTEDGRHWILSATAPRMAAANTSSAQNHAANSAMTLHRFQRILRAGWLKTASQSERPKHGREHRRKNHSVEAKSAHQRMLDKIHRRSALILFNFQEALPSQGRQVIMLHRRKPFADNRSSRH